MLHIQCPENRLRRLLLTSYCGMLFALAVGTACTAQETDSVPDTVQSVESETMNRDKHIPLEALFAAAECGTTAQSEEIRRIENAQQLEQLYQQLYANIISDHPAHAPPVDFSRSVLVFIAMGMKNTGGYSLRLASNEAPIEGEAATVTIHWNSPPADAITTQVLTNPCLLLKAPLTGYTQLRLVDQAGKLRGTIHL